MPMSAVEHLSFLEQLALFRNLRADELHALAVRMKVREYYRGEAIFWQGNPSDTLYLLKSGIVAVNHSLPGDTRQQTVAYIMQGAPFGEVGVLENQPRSANVIALTDVVVLVMQRSVLLEVLHEHSSIAIELARSLGRALIEASRRQLQSHRQIRVIVLVKSSAHCGQTTIGHALSAMLARRTGRSTVYAEYPDSRKLRQDLDFKRDGSLFSHPAGFDVSFARASADSDVVHARLFFDGLLGNYDNIVIGLLETDTEWVGPLIEQANQIVVVTSPEDSAMARAHELSEAMRQATRPDVTGVLMVVNGVPASGPTTSLAGGYDFVLPTLGSLPPLARSGTLEHALAEPFVHLAETLVDRLDRTHQISVYIPTTVDADQPIDTTEFVQRALAFLGQHFGGATSMPARGVWNSQEIGLISEEVHIVRTYATQADINQHLDSVVEFTKMLKQELRQEAMALEVDHKLVLI